LSEQDVDAYVENVTAVCYDGSLDVSDLDSGNRGDRWFAQVADLPDGGVSELPNPLNFKGKLSQVESNVVCKWVIYDTEGNDYYTSGSVVDLAEDDDLRYGPIDSLSRPDELIGSDVADSRGFRSSELDLDTSMNVSSGSMTIGSDDFDTLTNEWRDNNSGKTGYYSPSSKPGHTIFN